MNSRLNMSLDSAQLDTLLYMSLDSAQLDTLLSLVMTMFADI